MLTTLDLSPRIDPQDLLQLLVKDRSNEDGFKVMGVLKIHDKFVECVYCQCCVSDDVLQVCDV